MAKLKRLSTLSRNFEAQLKVLRGTDAALDA
jgi:hypothetical protein